MIDCAYFGSFPKSVPFDASVWGATPAGLWVCSTPDPLRPPVSGGLARPAPESATEGARFNETKRVRGLANGLSPQQHALREFALDVVNQVLEGEASGLEAVTQRGTTHPIARQISARLGRPTAICPLAIALTAATKSSLVSAIALSNRGAENFPVLWVLSADWPIQCRRAVVADLSTSAKGRPRHGINNWRGIVLPPTCRGN